MLIGRVLAVVALVVVLISGVPTAAEDTEFTRPSLKGLIGVYAVVEDFDEANKRAGFDKRIFQTDVELKLSMAGIRVLSKEEMFTAPGKPVLSVIVTALHESPNETAACSVLIKLVQLGRLVNDPLREFAVTTWSRSGVIQGDIPDIREAVKDATDRFINAWLSVNPKTGASQ